jgi:predicted transposase/invertase (TIGR01784 family)
MMRIEATENYNKGIKVGFDKGKREDQIEMVNKFFSKGLTMKMISNITDLPIKEVEKILNDSK